MRATRIPCGRSFRAVPLPILVLGGSRHQGALEVVRGVMRSGAAGVFFGRNVFQSDDMEGFLREARTILDAEGAPIGTK